MKNPPLHHPQPPPPPEKKNTASNYAEANWKIAMFEKVRLSASFSKEHDIR